MAKQVLIFWGIKVANFCQEVLNFLGSYTRVFTVVQNISFPYWFSDITDFSTLDLASLIEQGGINF